MVNTYQISEYIDNISFKESLGMGYDPGEVFEAICNLSSMYNQVLSDAYKENDELKTKVAMLESRGFEQIEISPRVLQFPAPESESERTEKIEEAEEAEEKVTARSLSDKELQRLKRVDLLELLLEQSKENEALKQALKEKDSEMKQLQKKLEDRKIMIEEAGTIAEASFQLNGVLEAAENAAKQYLDNLREMHDRERIEFVKKEEELEQKCLEMLEMTSKRCDELMAEAEQHCDQMLDGTERLCNEREKETEARCTSLEEKTRRDIEKRWDDLAVRVREMYTSRQELMAIKAKRG